jgi:hypothetical protein
MAVKSGRMAGQAGPVTTIIVLVILKLVQSISCNAGENPSTPHRTSNGTRTKRGHTGELLDLFLNGVIYVPSGFVRRKISGNIVTSTWII